MRRPLVFVILISSALFAACGARTAQVGQQRPIDGLRACAAEHPGDVGLWSELALAEQFEDGGEPKRAKEALAHAKKLGAKGIRLSFAEAELDVLEGRPSHALDTYLDVVKLGLTDKDPLAPELTEAALSSISDMNDAVDDYRARVTKFLVPLRKDADRLGLTAAHQLRMLLFAHATLSGDMDMADALAREAGCVQRARVAGPFGPRELLGFDQALPAEKPGPLADRYDLGANRGVKPTRTLETRRCVLGLGRGAHDALPGSSVLVTELEAKRAGRHALRVESPNSIVIWIDGKQIVRMDLRAEHPFGVRYVPLELTQGKHELRAKVSSRHPNPALSLALIAADERAVEATHVSVPKTGFERYVAAKTVLSRGDAVGARELLRKKAQREPSAQWLVLEAAASLADPLRPPELRRDLARELLRKAAERDPGAWYPTVGLANLEGAEGRTKEAIELLREAVKRWPEVLAIRTSLIEQLREAGYPEEADQRIEQLSRQMPHACAVLGLSLSSARQRGRVADVERLTGPVMACDATSGARLALLKAQRKYAEAAREMLRLRALADNLDEAQAVEADLEHARLSGDKEKERELRERRSKLWSDRPEPVLDHADVLLAQGQKKEAIDYLAKQIEQSPEDLYELRRVHEALGGAALFDGFRKDGREVIRSFEAAHKNYDQPQVLVLDYTVVRVFEDGSSVDLTHNILRMQSQEAVDENGEFGVPEGARLLTLHTIKADGTRLEPEAIAGKSTLSLPNLAPGDYVEYEMVRGESPSVGFPGGYLGNRFYFKSFEVPFDHTELVVVLPPNMEPVLDPRGPSPKTVRETKDGLTVLRWFADESRPLTPEPSSVASREFLPSINLGVKVSWKAYVESLRDLLVDKDMFDPAAQEEVMALLTEVAKQPASVRAERLYRWVTDQIEPTDDVFGTAPAMLAARTGSRERVLRYMLSLAGIQSELGLARGAEADHSQAALPDPETFGYLVLRVMTERGPVWMHAGARHAPFGYLPPQVRGERVLMLNEKAELADTPPYDMEADVHTVELDVKLAREGRATLHVREILRGPGAVAWRNDLDEIPQAELEPRFEESYAASVVPGARLVKLSFEDRDAPEKPLVIDYELEVDKLGHRVGQEQRISGLFPSTLSSQFARESTRNTTELVAPAQATDVRVRLTLPEGAKLPGLPRGVRLKHPGGAAFTSNARPVDNGVELTRSLRVPLMRVLPKDYSGFADFCRAVDVAEATELPVLLP